ncbi:MAG: hypothetical protein GKR97_20650 [Rhizobiaceae bacterium]|nr:hypothetical protein [Rhizobiaceae bacterium]
MTKGPDQIGLVGLRGVSQVEEMGRLRGMHLVMLNQTEAATLALSYVGRLSEDTTESGSNVNIRAGF